MNMIQTITAMEDRLEKEYPDVKPKKIDGDYLATVSEIETGSYEVAAHIRWMLDEMRDRDDYAQQDFDTWGKQMRWIGFIQGALWGLGYVSINDWREMNIE
jgi:hypothetical protein